MIRRLLFLFFFFAAAASAQTFEINCPSGTFPIGPTVGNQVSGKARQTFCVDPTGNLYLADSITFLAGAEGATPPNVLNASAFCNGSTDIDVCVNTALSSPLCMGSGLRQCSVHVPNNGFTGWNSHGTIVIPFQNLGTGDVTFDPGSIVNELCINGCDAVQWFAPGAANDNGFAIRGNGRIVGNPQAGNCIHVRGISAPRIYDVTCTGFTNQTNLSVGNGLLNEGVISEVSNGAFYIDNNIGVQNVGWAAGPFAATPTNNVQIVNGRIQGNLTGGVLENGSCSVACSFPNENNGYQVDIEGNGAANPVTTGTLTASLTSNVVTITGAGISTNVTPGTLAIQSGFSGGSVALACVNGRFLVTAATPNTYTYTCTSANGSGTSGGTVTGQKYQVFIENGNGDSILPVSAFMQWANGTSGFEAQIELGDSTWSPHGTFLQLFMSSVGSTNSIEAFSTFGTTIFQTFEFNNVTNFVNCTNASNMMVLTPQSNVAATNFISGCGAAAASVFGLPLKVSFTTTAAVSDSVTVTGITAQGSCRLTPTNATAAGLAGFISSISANTVVVGHTATAGGTFNLMCDGWN